MQRACIQPHVRPVPEKQNRQTHWFVSPTWNEKSFYALTWAGKPAQRMSVQTLITPATTDNTNTWYRPCTMNTQRKTINDKNKKSTKTRYKYTAFNKPKNKKKDWKNETVCTCNTYLMHLSHLSSSAAKEWSVRSYHTLFSSALLHVS